MLHCFILFLVQREPSEKVCSFVTEICEILFEMNVLEIMDGRSTLIYSEEQIHQAKLLLCILDTIKLHIQLICF